MKTIKTIIVGFGASARIFHAPLINANPSYSLLGFVERHDTRGQNAYPGKKTWASLTTVLAEAKPDLVVICTPNDTHVPLASEALEAGANVLLEKPFSTYSSESRELIALAKNKKRILTVFQSRRLDGDFLTVKELLDADLLGRIVSFESNYERWSPGIRPKPWKEAGAVGSTILDDLASHLIDQAVLLFGRPQSVFCNLSRQRDNAKSHDYFSIYLRYPEGRENSSEVQVRLSASMMARQPGPRFRIQGSLGSYQSFGMDPQEDLLSNGGSPDSVGYGEYGFEKWGSLDLIPEAAQVAHILEYGNRRPINQGGSALSFWNNDQQEIRLQDAISAARPFKVETLPGTYPAFYRNLAESIFSDEPSMLMVKPEESSFAIEIIEASRASNSEDRWIYV